MAEQITVSVDSDVANLYRSFSVKDRRKLDLLVNLRLRDATFSGKPLRDTMREIGRNAQRHGLTPDILQSILGRRMNRFVFDTNVMVSALLLNDSVPGHAFIRGLNRGTILISAETVSELRPCVRPGQVRLIHLPRETGRVPSVSDLRSRSHRDHRIHTGVSRPR